MIVQMKKRYGAIAGVAAAAVLSEACGCEHPAAAPIVSTAAPAVRSVVYGFILVAS